MKILHYLTDVDPRSGGVLRGVLDLCDCLSELNLSITLAHCGDVPQTITIKPDVHTCQVDSRLRFLGMFTRAALAKLDALVQSSDVVHLHTPWDPANLHVARLCRKHHVPYVVSTHGMLDDWAIQIRTLKKLSYLHLIARRFIASASMVHCTAEKERRQASKRVFRTPTVVIPLALDLRSFLTLPGETLARELLSDEQVDSFRILFLGRVHPIKGLDYAIEALSHLRTRGVLASLIIAGPGDPAYVNDLKTLARERSVDRHCHFVGSVEGSLKVSLLQLCQLLVLPSEHENFGLVQPEALAAGLPVVTTKNVAIWKELGESGGAEIVERSSEAFARAIQGLYDDPDRLAAMRRRGRDWAMKTFSGSQIARQYEAMYRQVIQRAATND